MVVLGGLGCDKVHARLHSYALRKQFLCSQIFSLNKLDRQKVDKIFISEQVRVQIHKDVQTLHSYLFQEESSYRVFFADLGLSNLSGVVLEI